MTDRTAPRGMPVRARRAEGAERERRIIDISPPVSARAEVWPGDTKFSLRRVMEKSGGASCNVTTIETTVHVGAHADAPLHFVDGAPDAAAVDLAPYVGPARVARVPRRGAITRDDVDALDLAGVERLLLHTRREGQRVRFSEPFAYLEPEAARRLGESGLRLVGIDTFSVDHPDSKALESHHALLGAGCLILEGLDLTGVTPGDYELIALPLRLEGCDASPVRAVLRELPPAGARRGLPHRARARAQAGAGGARLRAPHGGAVDRDCLHSRLNLAAGDVVRVTLAGPANVMLLDDSNYDLWEAGEPYEYSGGWAEVSPVEIAAPHAGTWNVVIDGATDRRDVGAAVQVLR